MTAEGRAADDFGAIRKRIDEIAAEKAEAERREAELGAANEPERADPSVTLIAEDQIISGKITTEQIAAGSITADKLFMNRYKPFAKGDVVQIAGQRYVVTDLHP